MSRTNYQFFFSFLCVYIARDPCILNSTVAKSRRWAALEQTLESMMRGACVIALLAPLGLARMHSCSETVAVEMRCRLALV